MKLLSLLWRPLLIVLVCVLTAIVTDRSITAHEVARGVAEVQIRMGAALGGLFASAFAGLFAAIVLYAFLRSRPPETTNGPH